MFCFCLFFENKNSDFFLIVDKKNFGCLDWILDGLLFLSCFGKIDFLAVQKRSAWLKKLFDKKFLGFFCRFLGFGSLEVGF
jgi:hypothetical protein